MSLKPILGHDGETPVLEKYDRGGTYGLRPAAMISPCPYAQWDATVTDNKNGAVTSGTNWWRVDGEATLAGLIGSASVTLRMFSTKPAEKLRATLTYGGSGTYTQSTAYVALHIDGPKNEVFNEGLANLIDGGTETADIDVPYYRYSVRLILGVINTVEYNPIPSGWVRVDLALV